MSVFYYSLKLNACDFKAEEIFLGACLGGGGAWASFTVYSYTLCLENTLPLIVSLPRWNSWTSI
jgi:hypothetical protein